MSDERLSPPMDALVRDAPQTGRVTWIGLRRERRGAVEQVREVHAVAGRGLLGDHRAERKPDPKARRQVTLIQAEHVTAVGAILGAEVDPASLRRNVVVSGINLDGLLNRRFAIGDAVLEGSGRCHPCSRMETNLGPGGYAAMRGHGGITAKVAVDGNIAVGDQVRIL